MILAFALFLIVPDDKIIGKESGFKYANTAYCQTTYLRTNNNLSLRVFYLEYLNHKTTNKFLIANTTVDLQSSKANTTILTVAAEGGGAFLGGAITGIGVAALTAYLIDHKDGEPPEPSGIGLAIISFAGGYVIGVPIGTAAGATIVGNSLNQGGSFRNSFIGSFAGSLIGLGGAYLASQPEGFSTVLGYGIAFTAPLSGAVIGYNIGKK